jgi:hypothetical protein
MRINIEIVNEELVSLCNVSALCRGYCDADLNISKSEQIGQEFCLSILKFLLLYSSLLWLT